MHVELILEEPALAVDSQVGRPVTGRRPVAVPADQLDNG